MKKRLYYYPVLLLYLEIVFHLYMGLNMKYVVIFGGFAIVVGMILSTINCLFPNSAREIVRGILTFFISILFCVEMICKDILQQYFQLFSAVSTAMGNHLEDYLAAIIKSISKNWAGLVWMFMIPAIFYIYMTYFTKRLKRVNNSLKTKLVLVPMCFLLHFILLGIIQLIPWNHDKTLATLYKMDTNAQEQVEYFGLVTMLRLDAKHALFGSSVQTDINLESLQTETMITENEEYLPNVLELDLDEVIENTSNKNVKWLSEYIKTSEPTMRNSYTGMFEGYNVIFITAEGFSGYMIDPKLTPTLYKLTNEGFKFKNFYSALHFTSTSGGEFQNLTGLYPKNGFPISMTETGKQGTYLPFTLANALNEKEYTSIGYHFNENMYGRSLSHPNLGYDWRQASDCGNILVKEENENGKTLWPQSDYYMIEQSIGDYIQEEPFHIYYLTLSGHLPYGYGSNQMSARNKASVEDLPYSEKTKAYIAAQLELEKGLTRLLEELEDVGAAERTLIVMAPDHIPYSDVDVLSELSGKTFGTESLEQLNEKMIEFDVYKNSLIIWSASMKETIEIEKICCQVDILPTLLNLLGVDYDSRLLAGSDILSDAEGLVVFSSSSWKTDKGLYNQFTGTFQLNEGIEMSGEEQTEYVSHMKTIVECKKAMTSIIIENDYYQLLLEE